MSVVVDACVIVVLVVADSAYIRLAQQLGTQVWTLDGPLAHNAADAGLPVQLIG